MKHLDFTYSVILQISKYYCFIKEEILKFMLDYVYYLQSIYVLNLMKY